MASRKAHVFVYQVNELFEQKGQIFYLALYLDWEYLRDKYKELGTFQELLDLRQQLRRSHPLSQSLYEEPSYAADGADLPLQVQQAHKCLNILLLVQ